METLLSGKSDLYASVYFGAILLVALVESIVPARMVGRSIGRRWLQNFSLAVLGTVFIRLSLPLAGVGWAVFCAERGWGVLNNAALPLWAGIAVTLIALDFTYYAHHYLSHRVGLLWRLHRTHHSDLEYDFSTGVRFHPFESIVTTLFIMCAIGVLGAPPEGVMLSQILLAAVSFAEHANVCLPERLDRALRLVIVTPNMHRIHHSVELDEGNSNFSNTLSIWDRMFGTYIEAPAAGHDGLRFGLKEWQDPAQMTLPRLLAQPFADLGHASHDEREVVQGANAETAARP
jgi:sterol desaturase/sphingolipid hydroxylase (fatty acid hydroxylase superfamily)